MYVVIFGDAKLGNIFVTWIKVIKKNDSNMLKNIKRRFFSTTNGKKNAEKSQKKKKKTAKHPIKTMNITTFAAFLDSAKVVIIVTC